MFLRAGLIFIAKDRRKQAGIGKRKQGDCGSAFSLRRTLNTDHGAGRMPPAVEHSEGASGRNAPKRGWPFASAFTTRM
jgi:hypothetical protein